MNFDRVEQALTRARFRCHRFATGQDAAQWLAAECSGKTVGIGGSMTAKAMKLEELLPRTSTVYWHWLTPRPGDPGKRRHSPGLPHQRQRPGGDRRAYQHRRHRQPHLRRHRRP